MTAYRRMTLRIICACMCLLMCVSTALADSYDVALYLPETAIATAPVIMQKAAAGQAPLTADVARPSALIATVRLDEAGVMTVYDGETAVCTFDELYAQNHALCNVGLRIEDAETAEALAAYVDENELCNLWLISADPSLLDIVRAAVPQVRGVVDITAGVPEMPVLYDMVYGHQVRTVLISGADASSATVRRLQEYDYMVFVESSAAPDAVEAYNLIVSGANAILTGDSGLMLDTLACFTDYTMTRGGIIIGHRGEYTYPNNSLPSFIHAAESGAQCIELDVWLTRDGYLVLSHDNNMDKAQQVQDGTEGSRSLTNVKWETTVSHLTYAGTPYAYITLDQLFDATADEYPDLIYRVEIKDTRSKAVSAVRKLIEAYGLKDRCQLICFDETVTTVARKNGYATLYLNVPGHFRNVTDFPDAISRLEALYRPLNSWYSSTWDNVDVPMMRYMQHYGLSVQPWPTSTENDLHGHFIEGYNGMTTDYCHWANDYVKYAWCEVGEDGQVTVKAQLYDGNIKDMTAWAELIVLDGSVAVEGMQVKGPGTVAARVRITLPTTYAQSWYYVYTPAVSAE